MFQFGFSSDQSTTESPEDTNSKDLYWLPATEILVSDIITYGSTASEADHIVIGQEKLRCVKLSTVLDTVKKYKSCIDTNILLAEQNHSDLIPSKYEGGLKIWECTQDIANYLEPSLVKGKRILDLGCGVGLLGILALKLGADAVCFQDYNAEVLQFTTIPNVQLNAHSEQVAACTFFSGDWESFTKLTQWSFDMIISSETIYNPANYLKLHNSIERLLQPMGTALVGAKSYYFGVGGSTRQFEKLIQEKGVFNSEVVWKSSEGVLREILKLTFKKIES